MYRCAMKIRYLLALIVILWNQPAMAIEEPRFTLVMKAGMFEVRQYAPMLIAETMVEGDMDEASNRGFRRIADYIFGNNQSVQTGSSSKIAMTAPVTMSAANSSSGVNESNMAASNKWRVHFVMPSQYSMANIPQPKNTDVKLREVPGKYFAVYSYTGFNTQARVQDKTNELMTWVQEKKLKAINSPQLSRYDPPWTLPMFRRNEIMVEIEEAKAAP